MRALITSIYSPEISTYNADDIALFINGSYPDIITLDGARRLTIQTLTEAAAAAGQPVTITTAAAAITYHAGRIIRQLNNVAK